MPSQGASELLARQPEGMTETQVALRVTGATPARQAVLTMARLRFLSAADTGPAIAWRGRSPGVEGETQVLWLLPVEPLHGTDHLLPQFAPPGSGPVDIELAGRMDLVRDVEAFLRMYFDAGPSQPLDGEEGVWFRLSPTAETAEGMGGR
jgi:hypothetical protein